MLGWHRGVVWPGHFRLWQPLTARLPAGTVIFVSASPMRMQTTLRYRPGWTNRHPLPPAPDESQCGAALSPGWSIPTEATRVRSGKPRIGLSRIGPSAAPCLPGCQAARRALAVDSCLLPIPRQALVKELPSMATGSAPAPMFIAGYSVQRRVARIPNTRACQLIRLTRPDR